MFNLTKEEEKLFKNLNTPSKIQDFMNKILINFEEDGRDTCFSPRAVLKLNKCHCIEGAVLAALILRVNGFLPLLVDLTASKADYDHVVAVFQIDGKWGAISKTNHVTLRYREPIYDSIRELVMSYFNEYFNDEGKKTLRSYSDAVDLSRFDDRGWMTCDEEVWYIPDFLADVKHHEILTKKQIKNLKYADPIEIEAGKLLDYHTKKARKNF